MEFTSTPDPECPKTVTLRRNPSRRAKKTSATHTQQLLKRNISSFPLDEILKCDLNPPNPSTHTKHQTHDVHVENLRVFLRIKPNLILHKKYSTGVRPKTRVFPKPVTSKAIMAKDEEVCLFVTGPHSVTLLPPASLQDSKRLKTEVYDGFSHVFEPHSLQREVYEKVMDPLLLDFINGKSGMVAALGPTGSGKTHTIFGCPREPGLVPLALRKIFYSATPGQSSSFLMSMFEIHSERGKGERILDLSLDGAELCLQQSSIKGLQEIFVSNVTEAEAFIAQGLLKRATAITNSNSQSSRSQCIINIRAAPERIDGESEVLPNSAVLSIVDLAGAEREKKTGNQGSRLLESNFINNTSMVFGLCLRSLLEHQKNPKKPLQKHFQSSLLTRYMREYLEGKKRMTLILTVKSAGDDYLDTSFLLRQASPYMKIKFNTVEEPNQKRQSNKLPQGEQPKRRKLKDPQNPVIDEIKNMKDGDPVIEKEGTPSEPHHQLEHLEPDLLGKAIRKDQVMKKFSKALWNVLKEYKQKLEESKNRIESLTKTLQEKDVRYAESENELAELKSYTSKGIHHSIQESENEVQSLKTALEEKDARCMELENELAELKFCSSNQMKHSTEELEKEVQSLKKALEQKDARHTELEKELAELNSCSSNQTQHSPEEEPEDETQSLKKTLEERDARHAELEKELTELKSYSSCQIEHSTKEWENRIECVKNTLEKNVRYAELGKEVAELKSCSSNEITQSTEAYSDALSALIEEGCHDPCNVTESESEPVSSSKSLKEEKPRRRLLPASSILIKEINGFDFEAGNDKPRESRGGGKLVTEGRERTQGNILLLKLLKNNVLIR